MQTDKLAPGLIVAVEDYWTQGPAVTERLVRSMGVVAPAGGPKPARSIVFIHAEPEADLGRLASYGVELNQARGRVRTGILPLASLGPVSDAPEVRWIAPSRLLRPLMDVASPKVHLPGLRARTGLTGQGVVIGIVDTGIDPHHPAFAGRILRVWDQTVSGPGVPEGGYGVERVGPAIAAVRDRQGHGTHVAGIAAGEDPVYRGVAPGAELVIVKTTLQDAHIADGVRYAFRVAAELGRPAVVNLSLGGHIDAHDGSDSLSQIIDDESSPGRIVCCAAGNEGDDNIHAQITVKKGTIRTASFRVPSSGAVDGVLGAVLNGWYPGADRVEVSIQSPGGFKTPFQAPAAPPAPPGRVYDLPDAQVHVITPGPDPVNGDHNFWIEVHHPTSPSLPATAGLWRLRLRGLTASSGDTHVWVQDNSARYDVFFTGGAVRDAFKIGAPGAATGAVTVGAYTTRVSWEDLGGTWRETGFDLDTIASFSSEGPARGGAPKPDLAAPGAMIAAAQSADALIHPAYVVAPGFRMDAGTSMATPFVAGIVALLLERDPLLDPDAVKAHLKAHSRIPGRAAGTFDPKWGFGLIDALGL